MSRDRYGDDLRRAEREVERLRDRAAMLAQALAAMLSLNDLDTVEAKVGVIRAARSVLASHGAGGDDHTKED